ncbi:hypothetical protein HN51_053851 [Arachis hypogaea]
MKSLHLTMIKAVANNVVVRKHHEGYNYNSIEVCLPGNRVPREFFAYKKSESSSIIVTELPDSEWLGFIYCVVLSPSEGIRKEGAKLRCQCQLVGGKKVTWLNKAVSELNSDHVYVWYDPLHCDNILRFHPLMVRFEFSVTTDEGEVDGSIHIKECGVLLISFSVVENVLQELELHLPVDLVEEENVLAPEEKPIALKDVVKQAEVEGDSAMTAQLLENLEGPLLDDHVLNLDDHSLMKGDGGPTLFRWLQDQALHSASVARYAEQVFQAASRSIAEKDEELTLARDEAVRKQESLKRMEDRVQDLNYQLAYWRRKYEEAQEKWRRRESALETEVAMLVASFQTINQHGRFFLAASWARPETGFFKVNCDGSVFKDERKAGFGCLLRDSSGRWVRGCCGKVAVTSGLRLELWSLWRGLLLALEAGIEFLVCETDSMEAFSLVSGWRIPSDHVEKDLVMRFFELKRLQGWTVRFGLIGRDANSVADWLAKEGAHGEAASTVWLHPPVPLQLLLQKDLA